MNYFIQLDIELFGTRYYGIVSEEEELYNVNWTTKIENATPLTLGQATAAKLFARQSDRITVVLINKAKIAALLGIKK